KARSGVSVVTAVSLRRGDLVGTARFPASWNARVDGYRRPGTTFKVNMALKGLPRFRCLPEDRGPFCSAKSLLARCRCLPEDRGQFGSTMHLLPDEGEVMASLTSSFADVQAGRLPEFPTIEWYVHTTVDPSRRDEAGHHNSALFVQWVPHTLTGTTWEVEEERYVRHLLSICDRFAPGTSDLVVDTFPLHPRKIEAHFGITGGHIHHVDNTFGFSDPRGSAPPAAWRA